MNLGTKTKIYENKGIATNPYPIKKYRERFGPRIYVDAANMVKGSSGSEVYLLHHAGFIHWAG